MLNKGLRDEEKIRIDNVLITLRTIFFVPKFWNIEDTSLIDNQLTEIDLSIENIIALDETDLINTLLKNNFDFDHLEQFADFLTEFSKTEKYDFDKKALSVYQYIQQKSNVFSFGINTKIASLQNR